jgi:LPS-assembly protein
MRRRPVRRLASAALWLVLGLLVPGPGAVLRAQVHLPSTNETPVQRSQPVFYQADSATYDRDRGLVTLSGHVEIWQGERVLRADKVTYDRTTGVAAATGHVVLLDPDGQVGFSSYAELTGGMKDGILRSFSAQLAENGKLAANGARRTGGKVDEFSRVIYTTCDLCRQHPEAPPEWDIRARSAIRDLQNKEIEYRDAVVDFYGVPVFYMPYFAHADPSVKRQSGFLVPSLGESSHLGPYFALPYFWAIDGQQDLTLTPLVAGDAGPELTADYRRAFNFGSVNINGSVAYDQSKPQGALFAKGQFAYDDEWRYGFDINQASSSAYLRDFKTGAGITDLLTSQVYAEGFGQGSYARIDSRAYQGLTSDIVSEQLPYVLPRYEYSYFGPPDALGGRLSLDTQDFNILRDQGTNTRRASLSVDWERPFQGAYGDLWNVIFHADGAVYSSNQLNAQPSFGPVNAASTAQGLPTAAVNLHWPFVRNAGAWGSQVIEPIAQAAISPYPPGYDIVTAADGTRYVNSLVPNEDSLTPELTDSNLFSLNHFSGIDRLEGGPRAALALHAEWFLPSGALLDGLIGQSYRAKKDPAFPVGSGLTDAVSDVVARETVTPNKYLDLTFRQRFDHSNWDVRFADAIATAGPSWLRLSGGYIYTSYDPFTYYEQAPTGIYPGPARNEAVLGGTTGYGRYHFNGSVRQDLQNGSLVNVAFGGSYEDECLIFSTEFYRRYTSVDGDHGATTILFNITLKTVGTFGYHAL